jgi:hypothetical protein
MTGNQTPPQQRPALRRPGRLVATWAMEGRLAGSGGRNIKGETTFRWLPPAARGPTSWASRWTPCG